MTEEGVWLGWARRRAGETLPGGGTEPAGPPQVLPPLLATPVLGDPLLFPTVLFKIFWHFIYLRALFSFHMAVS